MAAAPALLGFLVGVLLAAPAGANHIVMHGGPFGGVVVTLLTHPDDPEILYLGAFGSGVYKSVDGGRRWSTASDGLADLAVLTLAMDPVSPRVIYAGTDSGLFVSGDAGATWRGAAPAIAERNVRSLVVIPTRPTVLYAATDQGVLWSWDQGATWAPRGDGIPSRDVRVLRFDPANPARLFAAGFGGVFRSGDEGRHWKPMNRGLGDLRVRALAIDPTRPALLYAGTAGGGVFASTDGGSAWRPVNEGLRNRTVLSLLVTSGGERFAGTVGGVYRWDARSAAWELVGEDVLTLTITFLASHPRRSATVYAGTGGLLFVSDDRGLHWRELAVSVTNRVGEPVPAGFTHSADVHSRGERR